MVNSLFDSYASHLKTYCNTLNNFTSATLRSEFALLKIFHDLQYQLQQTYIRPDYKTNMNNFLIITYFRIAYF